MKLFSTNLKPVIFILSILVLGLLTSSFFKNRSEISNAGYKTVDEFRIKTSDNSSYSALDIFRIGKKDYAMLVNFDKQNLEFYYLDNQDLVATIPIPPNIAEQVPILDASYVEVVDMNTVYLATPDSIFMVNGNGKIDKQFSKNEFLPEGYIFYPEKFPLTVQDSFLYLGLTQTGEFVPSKYFHEKINVRINIKDSSNLLPGHGGVFDRIDTWLWSTTIGYYLIQWLF